jgi:hypothetical protein
VWLDICLLVCVFLSVTLIVMRRATLAKVDEGRRSSGSLFAARP